MGTNESKPVKNIKSDKKILQKTKDGSSPEEINDI